MMVTGTHRFQRGQHDRSQVEAISRTLANPRTFFASLTVVVSGQCRI